MELNSLLRIRKTVYMVDVIYNETIECAHPELTKGQPEPAAEPGIFQFPAKPSSAMRAIDDVPTQTRC